MPKIKYTEQRLREAVEKSKSLTEVLRNLDVEYSSGNMRAYLKDRILKYNIDMSHFVGMSWKRGLTDTKRLSADELLVYDRLNGRKEATERIRRALTDVGIKQVCVECNLAENWNGKPIQLQIDHIDGDWKNNRRENLRYLCPNCHSQTETFGSKNRR